MPEQPTYIHRVAAYFMLGKDETIGSTFAILSDDMAAGRVQRHPPAGCDIYFSGCVRYADVTGQVRVTGFGWKFDSYLGNCTLAGGQAYNYDRIEN